MKQLTTRYRVGLLFIALTALYSCIILRLYIIQIRSNDFFESLGNNQYFSTILQLPARALIYDRHGAALALNKQFLSAFISPINIPELRKQRLLKFLTSNFPDAAHRLHENSTSPFLFIGRRLTEQQAALLTSPDLAEISFIHEPGRYYPNTTAASIVGITTIDNEGIAGIELSHNTLLRGKASLATLKRDARQAQQFSFERTLDDPGREGDPVYLTIDSTLQFVTYEAVEQAVKHWRAEEGMAIIIDPVTGEIHAMVSYPGCNPNDSKHLAIEHLHNKVVTEAYEFGSVMKIFLALAAFEEGVVTGDTLINCYDTEHITLNGMKLSTWPKHGIIPFTEVITKSNNIGTAQIAVLLQEKLYEHYRRCGFGTKTHLMQGEQAGYITPPSTWSAQSLASLSYGYEIRTTLLQLACAFGMIARRGVPMKPHIISPYTTEIPQAPLYSFRALEQLEYILLHTVEEGTAIKARIPGCIVKGKTGSANLLVNGAYDPHKSIFTFAGIVEHNTYRRVIVVCIKAPEKHGIYSSQVAVPLFKTIAEAMLLHDGVIISF